jgi:orotidine-5'-phosphate decarboxylase
LTGGGASAERLADARARLIVALDVPAVASAEQLVAQLERHAGVFKIGLELLYAGGIDLAGRLAQTGHRVFIDAKLYDIPVTVERATAQIAGLGAAFLTVHAQDRKSLEAAVRGRGGADMKLLGVTVLTHLAAEDIPAYGDVGRLVLERARLARDAGFDGVVCSPWEAALVAEATGPAFVIVTPGIRPHHQPVAGDDQTRVATPADAFAAGAQYIVVGRPILRASDPARAADELVVEIAQALAARRQAGTRGAT